MGETIRRLVANDAAALRTLRLEALQVAPEAFSSSYDEELARPLEWFSSAAAGPGDNAVFGAFHDGGLVGMAGFVANARIKERHKGALVGLYVQPAFRRRGIARRLTQGVIAHACGRVLALHATVTAGNAAARDLHSRLGFTQFGTEPKALLVAGRFLDSDLLVLDLAGRTP